MKVLFIVTAYPRHDGDVITPWMGETIDRLIAAGTEVEVLAPSYKGSATSVIGGVKVHRFRYAPASLETLTHDMPAMERIGRNPAFAALLPLYIAAGSRAAAKVARDGHFDVVHVFWPIPHGIFGIAAKNASRAALVSTFFSAELMWRGATGTVVEPILKRIVDAQQGTAAAHSQADEEGSFTDINKGFSFRCGFQQEVYHFSKRSKASASRASGVPRLIRT